MLDTTVSADPLHSLYSDHHGWLHGWLRRRLGCHDQAADLAQDAFLKVVAKRETLYLSEARALLTTIARGLVVDHYRRAALERAYLDALAALPENETPSPEVRYLLLETLVEIDRLLDGLPPKVRRAFLLSQIDGCTYAQIAHELDVSISSVQQYMTRAYRVCYAALQTTD